LWCQYRHLNDKLSNDGSAGRALLLDELFKRTKTGSLTSAGGHYRLPVDWILQDILLYAILEELLSMPEWVVSVAHVA
jgi:hypothetical protein